MDLSPAQQYEIAVEHWMMNENNTAARIGRYMLSNGNLIRGWQFKACLLVAYATDDGDEAERYVLAAEDVWEALNESFRPDNEPGQRYLTEPRRTLDGLKENQRTVPIEEVPFDEEQDDSGSVEISSEDDSADGDCATDDWEKEEDHEDEDEAAILDRAAARLRSEAGRASSSIRPIATIYRALRVDPGFRRFQDKKEQEEMEEERSEQQKTGEKEGAALIRRRQQVEQMEKLLNDQFAAQMALLEEQKKGI